MSSAVPPNPAEEPLTLAALLAGLRRRRALLLWPVLLLLTAAALSCLCSTRRYRATTEIQVQKEDGGAFGLETTVMGPAGGSGAGDSFDYSMTLQTEAGILRSPALALAVIQAEQLEATPDYFAPAANAPGALSKWVSHRAAGMPWHTPLESLATPLESAPNRRYAAEKIFKSHLKVEQVAGTRLIDISYTDRDPARAAAVANTIARVLADMAFQQRFTAALQGSAWLSGQLEDLRRRTERAQGKAAALERGTGMFGEDGSRNVVLERLDSLNQNLTAAEGNRILKEGIDRVAASASPELISSLSGNSSTGSVASINTSLSLIQGLRQQESQVRAELGQDSVRYGPAYPKIAELKAQLAGITSAIAAEDSRLGQRAHTDLLIAQRQEDAARAAFEKQKELATRQNDTVIAYKLAHEEAESSRDLYEGLLAKLKQSSLLAGLRANNISIVSAAQVPPPGHATSPNVPLRLAVALAAGLLMGGAAALWAELTDDSIQSLAQLEAMLGVPLLAVLPAMERSELPGGARRRKLQAIAGERRQKRLRAGAAQNQSALPPPRAPAPSPVALPVLDRQFSIYGEGLRSLRTALQLSRGGALPRVILVTSCLAAEGKTTLAVNLAALFAQAGARVLLVDADLRRPTLHNYCPGGEEQAGLAMALSGPAGVVHRQPIASMPNFEWLAGNEVPPFPSELLGSRRMQELVDEWRAGYDLVVLDSPPVLPVTDAVLLARHSDATLLVARHKSTTKRSLQRGIEVLQMQEESRAPFGVVMNGVARGSGEFYQYFGYEGGVYASQGS